MSPATLRVSVFDYGKRCPRDNTVDRPALDDAYRR
jgi:hypothetical protein